MGGIGSHIYNLQNPYLGLGNGRRYWGEAVLGGGGIGRGGIGGTSDDYTRPRLIPYTPVE